MSKIDEILPTYYKLDCPNETHIFVTLDNTVTCIYCWVEDNPPKRKEEVR